MSKLMVGTSFKMKKTVSESIDYACALNNFVNENKEKLKEVEIFFLPTFLPLYPISNIVNPELLKFGSQDCGWEDEGAFTGEVSAMHLKDIGCTYAMVGHAERRNIFGEDDAMINRKLKSALKNGLTPILCIGEKKRHKSPSRAIKALKASIYKNIEGVPLRDITKIVIAYEPIWAIGVASSAPVDYISESMDRIRRILTDLYGGNVGRDQRIIYGGSVNMESAYELLKIRFNDGIFIARAALDVENFKKMIMMAAEIQNMKK